MTDNNRVKEIYSAITERIERVHIGCFRGLDKPLFLISDAYPGVWLEHVYDSVFCAKLKPEHTDIAVNTLNLFIDRQRENGQLPCYVWDANRISVPEDRLVGYSQTQECVSFAKLCLEVCEMTGDRELLEKCYKSAVGWEGWYRANRMTSGRGLVEMFVGYDTGHDNSGRLAGLSHIGNYCRDAAVLPPDDAAAPVIAVDMNANFYATETALADMAEKLGRSAEAAGWRAKAAEVKRRLFEVCLDREDAFFYDVDRNGNKRRYRSSTILHLFLEKVLDPADDAELIREIYVRHLKNPDEFWTEYPFPSMAANDPSTAGHAKSNCWGYYSQALIALRCTRWMDDYGFSADFDCLCEKWLSAWTEHFGEIKLGQELDPFTGIPSPSSEWYSSCMLFYIFAARRLRLV